MIKTKPIVYRQSYCEKEIGEACTFCGRKIISQSELTKHKWCELQEKAGVSEMEVGRFLSPESPWGITYDTNIAPLNCFLYGYRIVVFPGVINSKHFDYLKPEDIEHQIREHPDKSNPY